MAIRVSGSIIGTYHPIVVSNIYVTDSEALVEGRAYYLSSGRWTKSATTAAIQAICLKAEDAGTDVLAVMELVKTGDILEGDYTGTANAAFIPGLQVAVLDADGSNVDAATVTGGLNVLLSKDTGKLKCNFIARNNFTEAS